MTAQALEVAPITILGRIMPASNHTYLCRLGEEDSEVKVVYKPVSGEQPLWDFQAGTLAGREYAAFLVSEASGWHVVPPTTLRSGPAGQGMVQLWREPDPQQRPVDVLPAAEHPCGYLRVLEAVAGDDRPVVLVHEDSPELRRMALFDAVVNNTDRKGGHVLAQADGSRLGVDHGVCFHSDDKLRTVLWGWAGQPIRSEERSALQEIGSQLAGQLGEALTVHLTPDEIRALDRRLERLLDAGKFPSPPPGWPAIPWPPL